MRYAGANLEPPDRGGTMIRLAAPSDACAIAALYAPFVTDSVISFEATPPTGQEMQARVASALDHAPFLVAADPADGGVLGFAYASKHRERAAYRWSVDVSVYVDERAWRRGVGRGLYTSLFALLRLQGFYTAHAGITLPNPASVGLHESLGFRPVGVYSRVGFKCGRWHDVGWWQLELRDRSGEPRPTLPMEALRRSTGWDEAIAAGLTFLSP